MDDAEYISGMKKINEGIAELKERINSIHQRLEAMKQPDWKRPAVLPAKEIPKPVPLLKVEKKIESPLSVKPDPSLVAPPKPSTVPVRKPLDMSPELAILEEIKKKPAPPAPVKKIEPKPIPTWPPTPAMPPEKPKKWGIFGK